MKIKEFIYPKQCYLCGWKSEDEVCYDCFAQFKEFPYKKCPLCFYNKAFDGNCYNCNYPFSVYTCFFYEDEIKKLILQLKYYDKPELVRFFASFIISKVDRTKDYVFVSVPMSRLRLLKRGYNVSSLLCLEVKKQCGGCFAPFVLKKIGNKVQKDMKNKEERIENSKKSYVINDFSSIKDKHVILIDDVISSGGTIIQCSKEIMKFAKSLTVFTICKSI